MEEGKVEGNMDCASEGAALYSLVGAAEGKLERKREGGIEGESLNGTVVG